MVCSVARCLLGVVHRLLGGHIEQMDAGLREPLLDRIAPISVCQRPRDHRELIGGVVFHHQGPGDGRR